MSDQPPVPHPGPLDLRRLNFLTDNIAPPARRWVTPDDLVVVGIRNSLSGVTVSANVRLWLPEGSFGNFGMTIKPVSDRSLNFFTSPLYYGYAVSAAAYASGSPTPRYGQTFVSLVIARAPSSSFLDNIFFGAGYVAGLAEIGEPQATARLSTDGAGFLQRIAVTTPAAGADWTQTVPTNARWRIRGVRATLTTSAAVANRNIALRILDGAGNVVFTMFGHQGIVASTGNVEDWSPGASTSTQTGNEFYQALATDLQLFSGWVIQTGTQNLQAGDQWSAISLEVEEWIED